MIAWSIKAAEISNCFDEIFVSTDDQEIASIAKQYGAKVPFIRSKKFSDDFCSTQSVIKNSIEWCINNKLFFDNVCCIYPCSPFIQSNDIKKAFKTLRKSKKNVFVYPATSFTYPIPRAIAIDNDGYSKMLQSENFDQRSQDLEKYFHDAGQFYWANTETWLNITNIFNNGKPIIIPNWRVQDIDEEEDLIRAEVLFKVLNS